MGGEGHGSQSCLWNDTPLACHNHLDPHHQHYVIGHDSWWSLPTPHHGTILESHSIDLALHKVFRLSWHLEEWEILTTCCLKILQIHKMSCCQLYLGALCRLIIGQIKSFPNLPESISAVSSELVLHAEALHRRPQRTRNWERNARRQKSLGLIGGQFSERAAMRVPLWSYICLSKDKMELLPYFKRTNCVQIKILAVIDENNLITIKRTKVAFMIG